jgi:hypothetical protein
MPSFSSYRCIPCICWITSRLQSLQQNFGTSYTSSLTSLIACISRSGTMMVTFTSCKEVSELQGWQHKTAGGQADIVHVMMEACKSANRGRVQCSGLCFCPQALRQSVNVTHEHPSSTTFSNRQGTHHRHVTPATEQAWHCHGYLEASLHQCTCLCSHLRENLNIHSTDVSPPSADSRSGGLAPGSWEERSKESRPLASHALDPRVQLTPCRKTSRCMKGRVRHFSSTVPDIAMRS